MTSPQIWNGSAFVNPTGFKVWNGSAFVDPELHVWDGAAFQKVWPTSVPVAFQAVGTKGQSGATSSGSSIGSVGGAHNCPTSDANTVVIAIVQNYKNSTATTTISCTYNGVAMTLLGKVANSNTTQAMFYMFNPPTGSRTVAATSTFSSATNRSNVLITQSYTGVGSVTGFNSTTANATATRTITTSAAVSADGMAVFGHGSQTRTGVPTSYNQTQRFSDGNTSAYTGASWLFTGDGVGSGSAMTSTATGGNTGFVLSTSVILNPA